MRYIVSLEFRSETLSLAEICELVGKKPNEESYDIGKNRSGRITKSSALVFFSEGEDKDSILEKFNSAKKSFGPDVAVLEGHPVAQIVSIAVFFESNFVTFRIPNEILSWAERNGFELEISCY